MKPLIENERMLPFGELIRGFANQSNVSKGEMKKVLRKRGIFFQESEKEKMVPTLATLLLSPAEFSELKDCQNAREDNPKKSSSRVSLSVARPLLEILPPATEFNDLIKPDECNYKLTIVPNIVTVDKNPNKTLIYYEIERYDLNKSWYESKNIFQGSLLLELNDDKEVLITKSYTSTESEEVGNKFQNYVMQHFKKLNAVDQESELKKILFNDFTNEQRIIFFFRLTSQMDSVYFKFKDIEDMEFRPDEDTTLPESIDWMKKKKQLILKGSDIHNTFFIKETSYHPYLQFWSLDAKFDYEISGVSGNCVVTFQFKDFVQKEKKSEFEINISSLALKDGSTYRDKTIIKKEILEKMEDRKNSIYKSFFAKLEPKDEIILSTDDFKSEDAPTLF